MEFGRRIVMAAVQTTTLAVTLHHMPGGADQSPVTGRSCPHVTQGTVFTLHTVSLTSWSVFVTLSLFVVISEPHSRLSCLCSLSPEKWLAAAPLGLGAPLLLCPGTVRPGLTQHDWTEELRSATAEMIRDELSLDCHKLSNSHKCSHDHVL